MAANIFSKCGLLAVTVATSLLTISAVALPASAEVDQDGRRTASTAVDGTSAVIYGNGFSATASQCALYAVLVYDSEGTDHMVEAGLVRCNGASIDGTCDSGYSFVERYNGSAYYCSPGLTFSNNTGYSASISRASSTSTTMNGAIHGASNSQTSFGTADTTTAYAWGEATGGSTCPSPSKGTFALWKRLNNAAGWSTIDGASLYRLNTGMSGAPCWDTVSGVSGTGGFYVD